MDNGQKTGSYILNPIDVQKNMIEGFARNKGLYIKEYYIDETAGPTPLDNREAYKRLMADIAAGKINSVIVYSFDNLSGDKRDIQDMIHDFAEVGVDIYAAATGEYINPSDPITREQRLLADAMRQMEDRKERLVREGRQERVIRH